MQPPTARLDPKTTVFWEKRVQCWAKYNTILWEYLLDGNPRIAGCFGSDHRRIVLQQFRTGDRSPDHCGYCFEQDFVRWRHRALHDPVASWKVVPRDVST